MARRGKAPKDPARKLRKMLERLPADLRRQALTHASWTDERTQSYERLAFLGDSVLSLAVSSEVFPRFPDATAGKLTKTRAQAVSGRSCAEVALALGLPDLLRASAPEGGGRGRSVDVLLETERALASVTEAVIGACYLAHGYEKTAEAVVEAFGPQIDFASEYLVDFKSALQERLARSGSTVSYRVIREEGPPHDRRFEVVARVNRRVVGHGGGRSKKAAEQVAAQQALKELDH